MSYAVLCKECPQKMVAECIKLGFSAYQPHITDEADRDRTSRIVPRAIFQMLASYPNIHGSYFGSPLGNFVKNTGTQRENMKLSLSAQMEKMMQHIDSAHPPLLSPVLLAVLHGLPVVTRMLYESGSCSNKELSRLLKDLREIISHRFNSGGYRSLYKAYFFEVTTVIEGEGKNCVMEYGSKSVAASAHYLMKVCSTPRTLLSSCRLVISRCISVCRQRHRDAAYAELLLPQPMTNYVMFSDLSDTDYGQHEIAEDETDTDDNSSDNDQDSSEE